MGSTGAAVTPTTLTVGFWRDCLDKIVGLGILPIGLVGTAIGATSTI